MVWWNTLRLKSNSPEVRRKALENLDATGDPRALELLVAGAGGRGRPGALRGGQGTGAGSKSRIRATPWSARCRIRQGRARGGGGGLGRLGDGPAHSRHSRDLLKDSDSRRAGVRGGGGAAQPGLETLHRRGAGVFEVALGHARAAALAGQAAVKALVTELKHDTSFKRRAAAEALEDVDDPRTTQPLLAALKDEDPTVRVSAIHALSKDASAEVMPRVLALFRDGSLREAGGGRGAGQTRRSGARARIPRGCWRPELRSAVGGGSVSRAGSVIRR